MCTTRSRNVLRARRRHRGPTETEGCAHEGPDRGRSPLKASLAVAAVEEAKGELLERASFPQDRAGLRALERWAKRFPERRPKRWRTPVVSVGTWRGGWLRPASRWWTCRPSFRRG